MKRKSENQDKILKFLKANSGEHNKAAIVKGTRLPENSVVSALRALRGREPAVLKVRKDGTGDKAPLFYSLR